MMPSAHIRKCFENGKVERSRTQSRKETPQKRVPAPIRSQSYQIPLLLPTVVMVLLLPGPRLERRNNSHEEDASELKEDKTRGCEESEKEDSSEEHENIPEKDIEMEDKEESGRSYDNDVTTPDITARSHGHHNDIEMHESCPVM